MWVIIINSDKKASLGHIKPDITVNMLEMQSLIRYVDIMIPFFVCYGDQFPYDRPRASLL